MAASFVCWRCGHSLADLSLPLQRLDECRQCHAELHVCKLCEFYSITVAKHCREPIAEEVKDKERANYCDYYRPRPDAYSRVGLDAAAKAQADFAALFAGGKKSEAPPMSAAERAQAELDALFKK